MNFPGLDALKGYRQFIVYRLSPSRGRPGKTDKFPINSKMGVVSDAHNPDVWLDAVVAENEAKRLGTGHGVGFVFTDDDPFWFLDLDDCLLTNNQWSPVAQKLCGLLAGAYVEVSQSGRGLHIIGTGTPPLHRCKNAEHQLELYHTGRFVALTGTSAIGAAAFDLSHALPRVVADYFQPEHSSGFDICEITVEPVAEWHGPKADAELIRRAMGHRSARAVFGAGASFGDLWTANVEVLSKAYPDPARQYDASSADAALAQHLAFWTGKHGERIERLMRQSALLRDKWQRADYLIRTISSACARQRDVLQDAQPEAVAWFEPSPLPNALPSVQAFNADLLPVALRPWVMDIAHRMQCPPDFPAVAALVAVSSLIGARAVVQPKARDDWQVVPNLWGMTVGRPGVKKSPALSEALRPLNRLQATEFEQWQVAHEAWALDCKVAELAGDANAKKAKGLAGKDPTAARALLAPIGTPAEPIARRYIVNDATVEKLGELLQQNPWGTLSYRDELYGLLTGLDKQGQEGARAFYLQAYDGNQGYTFDRIQRGTVHIPRVCLAMIGGIQPGRIQEYVRGAVAGGSADDGLLQRFGLTVWPDTDGEFIHVDQWPDTPAKQAAWDVFDRLAALAPASDEGGHVWRFDVTAQALFVEWLVPFETELRGDDLHPAMVSHLSKYRKLIPALALVFALIDTPDCGFVIGEKELIRALAWCDYLRTHASRLYAAAVTPETAAAAGLLAKIKAGKLTDRDGLPMTFFSPREVAKKGWTGLASPEAVRKASDVLADFDWLRREQVQTTAAGGRPSDRYVVNPATLAAKGIT